MTTRRQVATVRPLRGVKGTTYRVEWWYGGARRRTGTYNDRNGGRARAYHIADLVDRAGGDITPEDADAATRPASGADADPALPTALGYWFDRWFAEAAPAESQSATNYRNQFARLAPWRDRDVRTWTAADSQRTYNDLVRPQGRYAESTAVVTMQRLTGALSLAHRHGARPTPAPPPPVHIDDVESPGIALEEEDLDLIVARAASVPDLSDAVALMIETGMRIGEVCALRGGDLDSRSGTLTVARTVKDEQRRVGKPKNGRHGIRPIVIDPDRSSDVWTMLVRRREAVGRDGYLFQSRGGGFGLPTTYRDQWEAIVRGPGLPKAVRIHDLRHTNGSILLADGHPPLAIARRLGMSLDRLQKTYGRDLPGTRNRMGAGMAARSRDRASRQAEGARPDLRVV